ncbi:MAG: hypothetical protein ACRDQA_13615 [Nocardioidaceae bacterium]
MSDTPASGWVIQTRSVSLTQTQDTTRAIAELCEHLTATQTPFPGTDLMLRYETKSRR